MRKMFFNSKGNALVTVSVLGTIIVMGGVGAIQLAGQYFNRQGQVRTQAKLSGKSQNIFYNVAQRFAIPGTTVPVWYPETLPSAADISAGRRPLMAIFQPGAGAGSMSVPVSISMPPSTGGANKIYNFTGDVSGIGALANSADLSRDASGNLTEDQPALIGLPDIENLANNAFADFIVNPIGAWPSDAGKPVGLTLGLVHFSKYLPNSDMPALPNILMTVQPVQTVTTNGVTTLQATKTAVATATVQMDPPPNPTCDVEVVEGTGPIAMGTSLNFRVYANSIVTNAYRSTVASTEPTEALSLSSQSLRNLGVRTQVASFSLTPPTATTLVVNARVYGVRGDAAINCASTTVTIVNPEPPPLAPVCTLDVSPDRTLVRTGMSATLTLQCQNPVTSARINGIEVPLSPVVSGNPYRTASLTMTRTLLTPQTVSSLVTGPGGTDTDSAILGSGVCRWANPNHIENYTSPWGAVFPMSSGPYREIVYSTAVSGPATTYTGGYRGGPPRQTYSTMYYWRDVHSYGDNNSYGACPGNARCMGSVRWPITQTVSTNVATGAVTTAETTGEMSGIVRLQYNPADNENCTLTLFDSRAAGCFAQDVHIEMADGSQRKVQDLRKGNWVRSALSGRILPIRRIVVGPEEKPLWSIQVGSKVVEVTEDHPFLTIEAVKRADQLKRGERLQLKSGSARVQSVTRATSNPKFPVWNFELDSTDDKDQFVFANGIPTGNLVIQNKLKAPLISAH